MKWMAIVAILSLPDGLSLRADTIELKTGERVEGTFKQATSAAAVIDVGGQPITIPLGKVQAVYFGVAPVRTAMSQAPSQEAMDALKALRSVTGSGIAYRDYAQRVLDARVRVDRYLSSGGSDGSELRTTIRVAMLEYELAAQGWLAGSSPVEHGNLWVPMGKILEDLEVSKCPVVKAIIDLRDTPPTTNNDPNRKSRSALRPAPKQDPTEQLGLLFAMRGNAPGSIWPCASQQVANAERLVGQP